jgi:hypothetical protein
MMLELDPRPVPHHRSLQGLSLGAGAHGARHAEEVRVMLERRWKEIAPDRCRKRVDQ